MKNKYLLDMSLQLPLGANVLVAIITGDPLVRHFEMFAEFAKSSAKRHMYLLSIAGTFFWGKGGGIIK